MVLFAVVICIQIKKKFDISKVPVETQVGILTPDHNLTQRILLEVSVVLFIKMWYMFQLKIIKMNLVTVKMTFEIPNVIPLYSSYSIFPCICSVSFPLHQIDTYTFRKLGACLEFNIHCCFYAPIL